MYIARILSMPEVLGHGESESHAVANLKTKLPKVRTRLVARYQVFRCQDGKRGPEKIGEGQVYLPRQ